MYNRKKGFTLIELLCVILVLILLFSVSFSLVINILDKSKNTVDEISKKMILEAAEKYAIEYRESNRWKEEFNSDKISFCVSISSLINYGYFTGESSKLDLYKDKYIVKMNIINGVYSIFIC